MQRESVPTVGGCPLVDCFAEEVDDGSVLNKVATSHRFTALAMFDGGSDSGRARIRQRVQAFAGNALVCANFATPIECTVQAFVRAAVRLCGFLTAFF